MTIQVQQKSARTSETAPSQSAILKDAPTTDVHSSSSPQASCSENRSIQKQLVKRQCEISHERLDSILREHDDTAGSVVSIPTCFSSKRSDYQQLLREAPKKPVITTASLRELALSAIQNNLGLRINICHDPNIYFQPVSGAKGTLKANRATRFWDCITLELQAYQHALQGYCEDCDWGKKYSTFDSRLYVMFIEMRNLILSQVPESDKEVVNENFDVPWITRQIRIGTFDVARFSSWLSNMLMRHCAPMRDDAAQAMHEKMVKGAADGDMAEIVQGLDALSRFLEAMKLDVANHQLKTLKYFLIEDTVPFLKDCFGRQMKANRLDLSAIKSWCNEQVKCHSSHRSPDGTIVQRSKFECLVVGMAGLCSVTDGPMPIIFKHDTERFRMLREDVQLLGELEACVRVCNEHLGQPRKLSFPQICELKDRVLRLTTYNGAWEGLLLHEEVVALEIARTIHQMSTTEGKFEPNDQFADDVEQIQAKLKSSDYIAQASAEVIQELTERVLSDAAMFFRHTVPEISKMQTRWISDRTENLTTFLVVDLEDISRRLAHMAVLTWRVWSDTVFAETEE